MSFESDSSRASLPSRQRHKGVAAPPLRVHSPAGGAVSKSTANQEDAFLSMREEWMQAKRREQEAEEKLKQMAAQLARTEEAAKRILTRTDPSARGGTAAALLEAEQQLVALRAEQADLKNQLAISKQQAGNYKRQAGDLKKRLETAGSDQRRLALQLGRLQAVGSGGGGFRQLSAAMPASGQPLVQTSSGSPGVPGDLCDAGGGRDAEEAAEEEATAAETARRFARQQEQLATALERGRQLEEQLRHQELTIQQQDSELNGLRVQQPSYSGRGGAAAVAGPPHQGPTPRGLQRGIDAGAVPRRQGWSEGSEGSDASLEERDVQALRIKYLKSKSAVESLVASHSKLMRELESVRAQTAESQAQQLRMSSVVGQQIPECQTGTGCGDVQQQLRHQLAAANHRVIRLQIELDAAVAKLAVYQAQAMYVQQQEQQQVCSWLGSQQGALPSHLVSMDEEQVQQAASYQGVEIQRHKRAGKAPAEEDINPGRTLAVETRRHHQQIWQPQHRECTDLAGLLPYQNIIELHVHGAEMQTELLNGAVCVGPQLPGLTFLSVDFFDSSTQLTPVAEGCNPLYNTTLQFVVGSTPALVEYLSSGSAQVEVHRCHIGTANGAGVDYLTVATAAIPLASLLPCTDKGGGACNYQQVTLYRTQDGSPCGSLRYALAALKPVACHPEASLSCWQPVQGGATPPAIVAQPDAHPSARPLGSNNGGSTVHERRPSSRKLQVEIMRCRDLRPAAGSRYDRPGGMDPRVTLLLDALAESSGDCRDTTPPLHQGQLVFETGRACSGTGSQPVFREHAGFAISDRAAAQGCRLEVVVFDAGVEAPRESIIGVAHIHVPAATGTKEPAAMAAAVDSPAAGTGSTTVHPLLHPASGRHAGLAELAIFWD